MGVRPFSSVFSNDVTLRADVRQAYMSAKSCVLLPKNTTLLNENVHLQSTLFVFHLRVAIIRGYMTLFVFLIVFIVKYFKFIDS